jgi:hypothetical protein
MTFSSVANRMPKLKEICMRNFHSGYLSTIPFAQVPPHLVAEIISSVKTPAELAAIDDRPGNRDIPWLCAATDDRWHEFVLSRFWAGKTDRPELPSGATWRKFYDSLNAQRTELLQAGSQSVGAIQTKPKKSKVVDISEIRQTRRASPQHSRHYTPNRNPISGHGRSASPASSQKTDLGTALLRKWRNRDQH